MELNIKRIDVNYVTHFNVGDKLLCVNNTNSLGITLGKTYICAELCEIETFIKIRDDHGSLTEKFVYRFKKVKNESKN